MIYPTAPHRLSPVQIPGYIPKEGSVGKDDEIEAFAWWRREESTGQYIGMEEGLQTTADAIREAGGIDAVIGFSQGGCGAAFVASLLETDRPATFQAKQKDGGIAFPESFRKLREGDGQKWEGQGPLKFAVSYAGFWAPRGDYDAFYEPKIRTPVLHVIGSLDTVVEEDRTQGLIERTVNPQVAVHPGGHFVPVGKEWVAALVNFIRGTLEAKEREKEEESVEDMDMPF